MKIEKKTIIEIDSADSDNLKSAIKKISNCPEKVGFDKKDSLTADEIAVIKKLNDNL